MSTESGMVLVPLRPTDEMVDAGAEAMKEYHRTGSHGECPGIGWGDASACLEAALEAALAAAPASPPTPAVDDAMRESVAGGLSGLAGQRLDQMADLIMRWPLPASICSDPCVSMQDYTAPRYGTSLMTHGEALQMLEYVFARLPEPRQQKLGDWKGDPCSVCGCWHADYPHLSCTQEKKEPK